jgi:Na+/melibiose symporter-like transporter
VIVLFGSLTYAIIEAPGAGWLSEQSLALFGVSFAAIAVLFSYESRRREPLLELRFFRSIPFSGASVIAICAFAALGGFLFLNTLYLQEVRGLSALKAGLCTLPIAAMTLVFAPVSGRLVGSRGPRIGLLIGGAGIALGSALLTGLTAHTSIPSLVPAYLIFGIGFGMVNPPITNTAVLGMPAAQAGVAAAVASTSRQLGQTLGVAVVGAIAAAGAVSVGPGFIAASHTGWWIVTGCGVAVFALGLASTTERAQGTARHVAKELAAQQNARPRDVELVGV